jgi:predicted nucleotidyltransferase component of viral defense system
MKSSGYASATAFRQALEDRLQQWSVAESLDIQRLRRQVAFDRLLARLFHDENPPWLLKGGYAMELRIKLARSTRDIDLAIRPHPLRKGGWDENAAAILETLRNGAAVALHDFFVFQISDPIQDLDAAPYGGARYPVEARMDARTFAKFHLDLSSGDVLREPYVRLQGRDWLAFAGIHHTAFPAVSPEEQFAEKLHAYTLPRPDRPNTRVKDLIDLCLLIEKSGLDRQRLAASIRDTFKRRKTHPVPTTLPSPPSAWATPFAEMAKECGIPDEIVPHFAAVQTFLHPILAHQTE